MERAAVETAVTMTVKLGLDVHAADLVVCRQDEGLLPKPARRMRWAEFMTWVEELVQSGEQGRRWPADRSMNVDDSTDFRGEISLGN